MTRKSLHISLFKVACSNPASVLVFRALQLVINGVAHVIVGNFSAANGILHIIDKVNTF